MKVFFDTSVLVAALVKLHPMHSQAINWLKRAKSHDLDMIISSHTLAELYAVLTTLPVSPKITPEMAWRLISEKHRRNYNNNFSFKLGIYHHNKTFKGFGTFRRHNI